MSQNTTKQRIVKTAEGLAEEQANRHITQWVCGNEGTVDGVPISRPRLERMIRLQHELINDLVVELFCANPYHVAFAKIDVQRRQKLFDERTKRRVLGDVPNGKYPRHLVDI
jgi:hypothetical protein